MNNRPVFARLAAVTGISPVDPECISCQEKLLKSPENLGKEPREAARMTTENYGDVSGHVQ